MKLTSLEFDGLVSDFMFLRATTFWGETFTRTTRPRVKDWEFKGLYRTLDMATDLDPYFYDPYGFAQSIFPWETEMVAQTNTLLEKGAHYRDWDWQPLFYLGFNCFYFLHQNGQASEYLMQAAQKPDAMPLLASLALRLAAKEDRTENAILFLEQMLKREEDESLREEYSMRLEALQKMQLLERAVQAYKSQYGHTPAYLADLLENGLIDEIPLDPYGGEFYVDRDGEVSITSDFRRQF